jgi:TonB-linked SusC/RagA family outer membrane protein
MIRRLLVLIGLVLGILQVNAQFKTITGKVTDEKGSPLSSASVSVKNSKSSTSTNAEGEFSISVPDNATTLVVSYVGHLTSYVSIKGTSIGTLKVILKPDVSDLEDVVVTGYGTQRRKDLTGSVYKLKDSTFEEIVLQGPDQALRGKVPGVDVTQSSGTPGSGISVQIRGVGSINNGTQPLYVVDGVIVNTGDYTQIGVGGQGLNALSDINPNDIESYEILKDAAAAAIYGARGANGVVLITTKKGGNHKTRVSFTSSFGLQSPEKKLAVLNGPDYVKLIQEEVENDAVTQYGVPVGTTITPSQFGFQGLDNAPSTYQTTNWQNLIFKNSTPIQNYQLAVDGGDAKTKFYLSGNYTGNQGIILGSDYERFGTRFNVEHNVNDKLKVSVGLGFTRSVTHRIDNDNDIYGVLSTAILDAPYYAPYNSDGTYAYDPNNPEVENPIAAAKLRYHKSTNDRLLANVAAEYKILPSLTFKTQLSADYLFLNEFQFLPSTTLQGAAGPGGQGTISDTRDLSLLGENILTYTKTIATNHHITATAVASYQQDTYNYLLGVGTKFPGDGIQQLSAASNPLTLTSNESSYGIIGYLGRINYDYKGKYLLSASARRDGSSRLGDDTKWGTFPAVSAGWHISEEDFLRDNKIISDLKIKGSYGLLGNTETSNFASKSLVGVGANYVLNGSSNTAGLYPSQLGNPDLKWESTQQADGGIELGLFKDRITLAVDYYDKETKDLLLSRPLVASSGFTSVNQNIGQISNKGFEFLLNTDNIESKGFRWTSSFNISFNKNKIVKLSGSPFADGFASWIQQGQSIGSFYGYKVAGIFQTTQQVSSAPYQTQYTSPGDIQFKALDGKDTITSNDQTILGNSLPKYYGGFTNTFSYKGFELSVFLQFKGGNKIFNENRQFTEAMNGTFGQYTTVNNRWTPTHTNTNMPRAILQDPANNTRNSDRYIENGSYTRIKNIIFSYSLPVKSIKKAGLTSLKIFVQGQNLVTWTHYSGFDPEVSTFNVTNTASGTDFLTYPQAKSYTFGVNIGF